MRDPRCVAAWPKCPAVAANQLYPGRDRRGYEIPYDDPAAFANLPETTQGEVLNVMEVAAVRLEATARSVQEGVDDAAAGRVTQYPAGHFGKADG